MTEVVLLADFCGTVSAEVCRDFESEVGLVSDTKSFLEFLQSRQVTAVCFAVNKPDDDVLSVVEWAIERLPGVEFICVLPKHSHLPLSLKTPLLRVLEFDDVKNARLWQKLLDAILAEVSIKSMIVSPRSLQNVWWQAVRKSGKPVLVPPLVWNVLLAYYEQQGEWEFERLVSEILQKTENVQLTLAELPEKMPTSIKNQTLEQNWLYHDAKQRMLEEFHCEYLKNLLAISEHNISVAAEKAGLDRSNFKKIMRRYQKDL